MEGGTGEEAVPIHPSCGTSVVDAPVPDLEVRIRPSYPVASSHPGGITRFSRGRLPAFVT